MPQPIRHESPYPTSSRDEVAERLARHDARAALRRSIILKYFDVVTICGGTPALVWYVLTTPQVASPEGAGTLAFLVSLVTGARIAMGRKNGAPHG